MDKTLEEIQLEEEEAMERATYRIERATARLERATARLDRLIEYAPLILKEW